MTHLDWLTSADVRILYVHGPRLRSTCCGCLWSKPPGGELMSLCKGQKCCPVCDNGAPPDGYKELMSERQVRMFAIACWKLRPHPINGVHEFVRDMVGFLERWVSGEPDDDLFADVYDKLAVLWRDTVGDPYADLPVDAAWMTRDVCDMARAAYWQRTADDSLDPQILRELSDALEEAGCGHVPMLQRLRGKVFGGGDLNGVPLLDEPSAYRETDVKLHSGFNHLNLLLDAAAD